MNNIIPEKTAGRGKTEVTDENTAVTLGSGSLRVFATPAMILLIENTAAKSVEKFLDDGFTTVGSLINVKHLSPSPVGSEITCETTAVMQDRAKIVFEAKVFDGAGLIGEGTHERFIVNKEKFTQKAEAKIQ